MPGRPHLMDDLSPPDAERCTGCGTPTYVSWWEGEVKLPMCPECAQRAWEEPEAKALLLARSGQGEAS
jgi:hypothetical protein